MIHEASTLAVIVFVLFVGFTLGLSFYFARQARSAAGYYAADGGISAAYVIGDEEAS